MCLATLANLPVLGIKLANLPLWLCENSCQVLKFVGNQTPIPSFFPERWHFGRGDRANLLFSFHKMQFIPPDISHLLTTLLPPQKKEEQIVKEQLLIVLFANQLLAPCFLLQRLWNCSSLPAGREHHLQMSSGATVEEGREEKVHLDSGELLIFSSQWQRIFHGKAISFPCLVGSPIILK